MLDWRMFRYGFHGTHEAIPSVRDEFDIVGRLRLISLHTGHDNTAGRPLQPPRRSAILGGANLTQDEESTMASNPSDPASPDRDAQIKKLIDDQIAPLRRKVEGLEGKVEALEREVNVRRLRPPSRQNLRK